MDKKVVKSPKGQKFDFIEYSYASKIVKDFPKLIAVYEKLIPILEKYRMYTGASEVLNSVYDCKTLLEIQYMYYRKVYNKKGRITDDVNEEK